MLPDAHWFNQTQTLTLQFNLKDATGKTALWITSGLHACVRAWAHPYQPRSLGGPSISPQTYYTHNTESQPTSTVGSLLWASLCALICQRDKCYSNCGHGYATFASVPSCRVGAWKRRWRQAERSGGVGFTLCVWERYIFDLMHTLFEHWGHP